VTRGGGGGRGGEVSVFAAQLSFCDARFSVACRELCFSRGRFRFSRREIRFRGAALCFPRGEFRISRRQFRFSRAPFCFSRAEVSFSRREIRFSRGRSLGVSGGKGDGGAWGGLGGLPFASACQNGKVAGGSNIFRVHVNPRWRRVDESGKNPSACDPRDRG
jgi:hypothetical protein